MRARISHLPPPAIEFKEQEARDQEQPDARDMQIIGQTRRLANQADPIDIELLVRGIERPEEEIAEGTEQRVYAVPLAERYPTAQRLLPTMDVEGIDEQGRSQHQRADRHVPGIHTGNGAKDKGGQQIEKPAARQFLAPEYSPGLLLQKKGCEQTEQQYCERHGDHVGMKVGKEEAPEREFVDGERDHTATLPV